MSLLLHMQPLQISDKRGRSNAEDRPKIATDDETVSPQDRGERSPIKLL